MGPLHGIRIIEIAGLGPGPFAGMMLADHGAEVIRVDRPGGNELDAAHTVLVRSRRSITLDLKKPDAILVLRDLVKTACGLIEGFRPGVMERLGLGPETLLADNPKLVYGRMTGWGQTGPYAQAAGHDLNYIALAGNLHGYGPAGGKPAPPLNAVGDFGGGGMMLAFGMLAAMLAVRTGAPGQVIDCAMTDGAALLAAMTWSFWGHGLWRDQRGANLLDGGAPFYDSYETADGKYISLAPLEQNFFDLFQRLTGLEASAATQGRMNPRHWPALREQFSALFRSKTRDQWCALLEQTDVCFAPVLSLAEAPGHAHNVARSTFAEVGGILQPMPAPRYAATPTASPRPAPTPGADTAALLQSLGYDAERINALKQDGIFGPG